MDIIFKFIPFFSWIRNYRKSYLRGDVSAGLTVGIMLIPQGMAYASIAELPVEYGLYAALIPQVVYMLLGTSRQLAVGPVAMDSLLVATIVSAMTNNPEQYIEMAILLAFIMGSIQFIFGLLRFGFLVNFLSKPVITGFTSAAAIIIGLNQIKHLTGTDIGRNSNVIFLIKDIFSSIQGLNWASLSIGIIGISILFLTKRYFNKIPGALIVVILGTVIMYLFNLNNIDLGINIVEDIPGGLPPISIPDVTNLQLILDLLPAALTLALIAFMEAISVAKAIEEKHNDYAIEPNQELIALGLSNVIGSVFSSYPVTGGFSRSAVNDQAGAKTGISALISAVVIFITLVFLTDLFYFLPNTILASIILVAVYGLIDFKTPKNIWKVDRVEFIIYAITFLSTLTLGIQQGILTGVLLSLLVIIYNVSYPQIVELGRLENSTEYKDVNHFPLAKRENGMLIIRLDARLFYANTTHFKKQINNYFDESEQKIDAIIITAKAINNIDFSGINMLNEIIKLYSEKNVTVYLTALKSPIFKKLKQADFIDSTGFKFTFLTIQDAISFHNNQIDDQ